MRVILFLFVRCILAYNADSYTLRNGMYAIIWRTAGSVIMNALIRNAIYEVKGALISQLCTLRRSRMMFDPCMFDPDRMLMRIIPEADIVIAELNERAVLSCDMITGDGRSLVIWEHKRIHMYSTNHLWSSKTRVTGELKFANVTNHNTGDYTCRPEVANQPASGVSRLLVTEFNSFPLKVGAIGRDRIYITWNYTNIPGEPSDYDNTYFGKLTIKYKESGTDDWHQAGRILNSFIDPATVHYVIRNLKNRTLYQIKNVVEFYKPPRRDARKTFVLSKWVSTFEKDVKYVPTVWIVNKTVDTVRIKWSQPPPELREYVDAYLISLENGNDKEKHLRWQKFNAADRNEAVLYLSPSISYDLVVRACFDDYCPDQHASVVMEGVMTNDTVLTINVTRDAENSTAGSNASFTCSVTVHGYEGWWTKEGERVTSINDSDGERDWSVIVGEAEEGNTRDYTCVAKKINDSHTSGRMLVTVTPPTENMNVEAEVVHAKPLELTALVCDFFGYRLSNFIWRKISKGNIFPVINGVSSQSSLNETHIRMMLYFPNTFKSDSGHYECQASNNRLKKIIGSVSLEVLDDSPLQFSAEAIMSDLVYLRWSDSKFEGDTYLIRSSENGFPEWRDIFSMPVMKGKQSYDSYVVRQLTSNTYYWFELVVIKAGKRLASTYSSRITPTKKDFVYFPNITVISKTTNSITIEWLTPPVELSPHITVYHISVSYTYNGSEVVHWNDTVQTYRLVGELQPSTSYDLEVKACFSDVSKDCYSRDVRQGIITDSIIDPWLEIIQEADIVIAELNERAVLSCNVRSKNPLGYVVWLHEGLNYTSTNVFWIDKMHLTMELAFPNVDSEDAGHYTCTAPGLDKLASRNTRLLVKEFDFSPLKVGAIGRNRIYITWNHTNIPGELGDYDNTYYVKVTIKYKESDTNEWHQAGKILNSSIDPATVRYVIRDLENRTLYQVKNVVQFCKRRDHDVRKTSVFSKWVTTFEEDVEYVPTVGIVNKTVDTVRIKWSQPPPELREYVDAYLISLENGNDKEKHLRWQKFNAADRNEAVLYLSPSISYDLVVRACFDDYCPDQHASVVMKGVMTNDTAGREHFRAREKLEFDTQSSVLTINVTQDAENSTAGSNAFFTCSVTVQGYEGWWTKEGERVTSINDSHVESDWTVIVGETEEGNTRDYTCVAKKTNDLHTSGRMLVTVIPATENMNVEAEVVHAKPLESTALLCDFFGYRLSNFIWRKVSNDRITTIRANSTKSSLNETHIRMMLYFANTFESDSGRYECQATNNRLKKIIGSVSLKVSDNLPLQLSLEAIGSNLVHLRWSDSNFRGDTHLIRSSENGCLEWQDMFTVPVVTGKQSYNGYVVRQLTGNTSYWFELVVISAGRRLASTYSSYIMSTENSLLYSPNITVISKTTNSITIAWLTPPVELSPHITVYHISVSYTDNGSEVVHWNDAVQTYRIVGELQPSTSYDLEVKACFRDIRTGCYSSDVQKRIITESFIDEGKHILETESGTQVITWLPLTGMFFLLIGLGAWYSYKKVKKRRIFRERLAYFYSENPIFFNPEIAISDQADLLPYEKEWEFPRKLLRLEDELGSGSFGIVWKARAKTIRRPEAISVVAVKTVRPTASLRCMKALLRELKILIYLGHHPNIVSLLGACTKDLDYGRLLVIVEFCRFGNLHDYLWRCRSKFVNELKANSKEIPDTNFDADLLDIKSHSVSTSDSTSSALCREHPSSIVEDSCDTTVQPGTSENTEDSTTGDNPQLPEITPPSKYPGDFTNVDLDPVRTRDLVSWAWQISRGMQYLAAKKVLHGDLAARNVLLCEDNIVKICDFGLSKSLQDDDDYKDEGNDPLPVKWMAIESLRDGIFSVKSDVWSFGVVLWELFSLAKTPYPEINPANMCETLLGGYRMERPKYSPKSIYRTMLLCWDANPSRRPTFVELEHSIGNLMEENVKTHYIELYIRRERVYAEITDFRKARIPENQEPIPPDPTKPKNSSQDGTTKKPPFRMRFRRFFRRG